LSVVSTAGVRESEPSIGSVIGERCGSEFLMTQNNLAKMLGVQRAALSMFASHLQEDELIRYRRGRVHILEPDGLRDRACSCHRALEEQHHRILAASTRRRNIDADSRRDDRPTDGAAPD
jgi:Mn-dependent DtxR family transcriptional regulator